MVYVTFVVWSRDKMANMQLLFLLYLVAVTCCARCYAKHDFVKNKEVRLSEIVTPPRQIKAAAWEGLPYVLCHCERA